MKKSKLKVKPPSRPSNFMRGGLYNSKYISDLNYQMGGRPYKNLPSITKEYIEPSEFSQFRMADFIANIPLSDKRRMNPPRMQEGGKNKYTTKLTPKEEQQFKAWYKKVASYKGLDQNPDSPEHYYDYRGFWKNEDRDGIFKEDSEVHFYDTYKQPGHPTFSTQSKYSTKKQPGGTWSTSADGTSYFTHSPYTEKYADKTTEYLRGSGENSILRGDTIYSNPKLLPSKMQEGGSELQQALGYKDNSPYKDLPYQKKNKKNYQTGGLILKAQNGYSWNSPTMPASTITPAKKSDYATTDTGVEKKKYKSQREINKQATEIVKNKDISEYTEEDALIIDKSTIKDKNKYLDPYKILKAEQASGRWDAEGFAQASSALGPKLSLSNLPIVGEYIPEALDVTRGIGEMASGLGRIPLNVSQGNYGQAALDVALPLATGALGGLGARTTGQFANNLVNPLPISLPEFYKYGKAAPYFVSNVASDIKSFVKTPSLQDFKNKLNRLKKIEDIFNTDEGKKAFDEIKKKSFDFWDTPEGQRRIQKQLDELGLSKEGVTVEDFKDALSEIEYIDKDTQTDLLKTRTDLLLQKYDQKRQDTKFALNQRRDELSKLLTQFFKEQQSGLPPSKSLNYFDVAEEIKSIEDKLLEISNEEGLINKKLEKIPYTNPQNAAYFPSQKQIYLGRDYSNPLEALKTGFHEWGHSKSGGLLAKLYLGNNQKLVNAAEPFLFQQKSRPVNARLLQNFNEFPNSTAGAETGMIPSFRFENEPHLQPPSEKSISKNFRNLKNTVSGEALSRFLNPQRYIWEASDYFKFGDEPSGFLNELLGDLFQKGYIKNQSDKIDVDMLKDALKKYRENPNIKAPVRIFEFINPTEKSLKDLADELNDLVSNENANQDSDSPNIISAQQGGRLNRKNSDKEMVYGIADILKMIKNKDNRQQIAGKMIKDFNKENIKYNKQSFLKASNLLQQGGAPNPLPQYGDAGDYYKQLMDTIQGANLFKNPVENLPSFDDYYNNKVKEYLDQGKYRPQIDGGTSYLVDTTTGERFTTKEMRKKLGIEYDSLKAGGKSFTEQAPIGGALAGLLDLQTAESDELLNRKKGYFDNSLSQTSWSPMGFSQDGGGQDISQISPEQIQMIQQEMMNQQEEQQRAPKPDMNQSINVIKAYAEDLGFTNEDGSISKEQMVELLRLLESDVNADLEREVFANLVSFFQEGDKEPLHEQIRKYWNRGVIPMNRREDVLKYSSEPVPHLEEGQNFPEPTMSRNGGRMSLKGLASIQQGGYMNPMQQMMGYKDNSPYKDMPYQTFNTNNLTMRGVSKPLLAISDIGTSTIMQPGYNYTFPGASSVTEIPMAKNGKFFKKVGNVLGDFGRSVADSVGNRYGLWDIDNSKYKTKFGQKYSGAWDKFNRNLGKAGAAAVSTFAPGVGSFLGERASAGINRLEGNMPQNPMMDEFMPQGAPQQSDQSQGLDMLNQFSFLLPMFQNALLGPSSPYNTNTNTNNPYGIPFLNMREGGIPDRYKKLGFTKVGQKRQSDRPGKKWSVLAKKGDKYKIVHGGAEGMSDFTKHKNEKRRDRFWDRMGGKNSAKAKDEFSPLFWHKRFGTWQNGGIIPPPPSRPF